MNERWLDCENDDQAESRAESFWSRLRGDIDAGTFWADRIKQYRGDPAKRLQIALDNLPLPGAFREASLATRSMIRSKRKNGERFEEELGLLYWFAAIESFVLPYAERLEEPGFNVVQSIPGQRLRSLKVEYRTLGYKKLTLLNQTDRKWIVEAWGEPLSHQTLNEIHRSVWNEYEESLVQSRRQDREKSLRELRDLLRRR